MTESDEYVLPPTKAGCTLPNPSEPIYKTVEEIQQRIAKLQEEARLLPPGQVLEATLREIRQLRSLALTCARETVDGPCLKRKRARNWDLRDAIFLVPANFSRHCDWA